MPVEDTSLEAWQRIQPSLGRRQAEVHTILHNATVRGFDMTNREIARLMHVDVCSVTPRVGELRDLDLAELSQKRACGVTGYRAKAWRTKRKKEG